MTVVAPATPPQPKIDDDGYALLPGFVSGGDLDGLRREVSHAVAGQRGESCARPNNTLVPLRWNDAAVIRVLRSPDRVQAIDDAAGGEDLRWISGYVSVKEPASGSLWWHQDWWCWDHPVSFRRAAPQVAVLCYLTDTDAVTGALRVLPGSHLTETPVHALLPRAQDEAGIDPDHAAFADAPGQVTLALRAGDAVVIDYRLLHGTHSNAAEVRRDCLLLSFAPSWRRLPADLRAHLVGHLAQPGGDEAVPSALRALLPDYIGPRRDLPLNRVPPRQFTSE